MAIRLAGRLPYGCRKRLTLQPFLPSESQPGLARRALLLTTRRTATTHAGPMHADPRQELIRYLHEIGTHALGYASPTRLQLAINSLEQAAGDETIRVAILGASNGESASSAKMLIRALFADPLADTQEWESELENHDPARPLVVRISKFPDGQKSSLISQAGSLKELHIASPTWSKHNIELLFVEDRRLTGSHSSELSEDGLLDVPISIGGQTLVTPVHKVLAVADGITGASKLGAVSSLHESPVTLAAVNIPGYSASRGEKLPFAVLNVGAGLEGINLFRSSSSNGMEFERLWTQSNIAKVREWILEGAMSSPSETKAIIRTLVVSTLDKTDAAVLEAENGTKSTIGLETNPETATLLKALAEWSQSAHAELQEELDKAFSGRRWKQMKWWKLFWRVDDVGLLTSDILHGRFLPHADKDMIFLAGRISESLPGHAAAYSQPMSVVLADPKATDMASRLSGSTQNAHLAPRWPTHISFARRYLQEETVPALQALSQKLVLQTFSSAGLSASLGALIYASQFSVYEAGSIVALGTVLGLGRMQRKWGNARKFWEDDVREEGRKAVRAAERSMANVLDGKAEESASSDKYTLLRDVVSRAKAALANLK
ncbi:hypothetical protein CFIMG_005031RAa [Ceratocystis fimbriata CBS 114723]|uniref:Mmc1 C-terminal domain-containing protein n=1 Tax=Ceratocystis fimbriata CBS 114723 TaxID=1035309 RepID=A0A2C5X051_9PEZI|nr:hypothetical protein CFIMG_005031RAa [Ceratocystis fimbriata CBS 114723]